MHISYIWHQANLSPSFTAHFQLGIALFRMAASGEGIVALLECFPVVEGFNLSLEEAFEEIYIRYTSFQPYIS